MNVYLFLTFAFLTTACAQQTNNDNRLADDISAINNLREKEEMAAETGNVDALLALRSDDFIAMPPDQPSVKGKEAVREFLTGMFGQMNIEETLVSEEIIVSGDWAHDRGTFAGTAVPKAGGTTISIDGKYLWILNRQDDGSWKYIIQMWSNNSSDSE